MGTPYHTRRSSTPGCPPPIANFQTRPRVGGAAAPPCALRAHRLGHRHPEQRRRPRRPRRWIRSRATTVASNALTTFILGGKTQVQRALDARPTFATIWIGDERRPRRRPIRGILAPTPGVSNGIVSTQAQFQASYDAMIKQLLDSMPGLKGVLIGVAEASAIPLMSLRRR